MVVLTTRGMMETECTLYRWERRDEDDGMTKCEGAHWSSNRRTLSIALFFSIPRTKLNMSIPAPA